jgi:hypothetical protein
MWGGEGCSGLYGDLTGALWLMEPNGCSRMGRTGSVR